MELVNKPAFLIIHITQSVAIRKHNYRFNLAKALFWHVGTLDIHFSLIPQTTDGSAIDLFIYMVP